MSETIERRVNRVIRPQVRALQAYSVPDFAGEIKLDAMENPYVWPDELKNEWLNELKEEALNRYPDPRASAVCELLNSTMHIPSGIDVLLGNGSDEIIQMLILAIAGQPHSAVLAPEPSFVMYRMICDYAGVDYTAVDLNADFSLDIERMLAAINEQQPALIFLARPNNPTGNAFAERHVRAIVEASDGLVVMDEAYVPFTDTHALDLLRDFENVLVMRTLSKVGLAGLRLGLLLGRPEWISEIDKLRLPYNINVLTQKSVEFALRHQSVLDRQAEKIKSDRAILYSEMDDIATIELWPSEANFVLFRVAGSADDVHRLLVEQGVLIKNLHGKHRLLNNCLRVTVGTAEENAQFLKALKMALSSP